MDRPTDPEPLIEASSAEWGDAKTEITTGTRDAMAASWYLTTSRIWPLLAHPVRGPIVLGVALFVIVVATVLLSPSTESHFIYTDF